MEKRPTKKINTALPAGVSAVSGTTNDPYSDRMSVPEVAAYFNTTVFTVYRWLRSGKLPCKRTPTGRLAYVDANAVRKFQLS